jgi:hypothetical protein
VTGQDHPGQKADAAPEGSGTTGTRPSPAGVEDFLAGVEPQARQDDARLLLELMSRETGTQPTLWGSSIIGFGCNHYSYASGREGDQPAVAFAPRKANLVLYGLLNGTDVDSALSRLGPFSRGAGCLYLKRFADADPAVLAAMISGAYDQMNDR